MPLKSLLIGLIMAQLAFGSFFGRNIHIQLPFFGLDITKDPVIDRMNCDAFPGFLFEPFRLPFGSRRRFQAFNREANEKCPMSSEECLCVAPSMCSNGIIVSDGRTILKRRGKRLINTGLEMLGNVGTGLLDHMFGLELRGTNPRSIDWHEDRNFGVFIKPPFTSPDLNERKKFSDEPNDINSEALEPTSTPQMTQETNDKVPEVKNITHSIEVEETPKKTFTTQPVPDNDVNKRTFCPYNMVCCKTGLTKSKTEKSIEKCGQRRVCGIERRSDLASKKGEADFGEWPWQVALIKKRDDGRRDLICNGVLVDSKRVLTVAQCFPQNQTKFDDIEVRVGDLDLSSTTEPRYHKNYNVEAIHWHPNYSDQSLYNDIALVYLSSPVEMKEHIAPICLAEPEEQFAKDSCVITGWSKHYAHLRESYANYLTYQECEIKMQSSKLGPFFTLHPNFVCAMDAGIACRMKGGAPMACKRQDGSYALVGLLSWGVDCNGEEAEVFTKVQSFRDWLRSKEKIK